MSPSADEARAIIERSLYLVLATADSEGRPWASPVWFAPDGRGAFFWVSSHEARHSSNIAGRPDIGIVIFDSTAPIGTGQGVYIEARAEQLTGPDVDEGLAVFSARSISQGGTAWTRADIEGDTLIRMYRAVASSSFMLAKDGQSDHRVPVALDG
jgi:hypothetical protein